MQKTVHKYVLDMKSNCILHIEGMAFHPNFEKNFKVYIYYTRYPETPGMDATAVISEFKTNKKKTQVS